MATDALRSQVAAKWQDAFNRLNKGEPGISGLMTFSQVFHIQSHVLESCLTLMKAWGLLTDFLTPKDLTEPSFMKDYGE